MLFRWKRFDKRRQNAHGFALFSSSFSRKHVSKKVAAMLKVGPSLSSQASRNLPLIAKLLLLILVSTFCCMLTFLQGVERFSSYSGYGKTFEFTGDLKDESQVS